MEDGRFLPFGMYSGSGARRLDDASWKQVLEWHVSKRSYLTFMCMHPSERSQMIRVILELYSSFMTL
jgi:hypothetical protein